jgi:hypothetical protein
VNRAERPHTDGVNKGTAHGHCGHQRYEDPAERAVSCTTPRASAAIAAKA